MADKEFGVIGLGRMGGGLSLQAMEEGMRVVGLTHGGASAELLKAGLVEVHEPTGFVQHLRGPRIVFVYVPAGPSVDEWLGTLAETLHPGDIVVDGGNSYWGDSIRRARRLKERDIYFIDLGTSGGVTGARHGACFMAGGEREAVQRVEPILLSLALENGYVHAGPSGAGHFTKLVHNGIEFGMLQAIGEGMALLENYRDRLDIPNVLQCWRNGSVIRSWLIDLMHEGYVREGGLEKVPPFVEDTGEVNWLVDDALQMEVATPVIAAAVMQLIASRDESEPWARAIAMMRKGFGGHAYGASEAIVEQRRTSRVGGFVRD